MHLLSDSNTAVLLKYRDTAQPYMQCIKQLFYIQVARIYRIWQNFQGEKLSRLCLKYTIHWKIFVVHQAVAIFYYTQQVIQGENFCDRLKNCENSKSFPLESFAIYNNV